MEAKSVEVLRGAETWLQGDVLTARFPGKPHASLKLSQMEAFMGKILPTRRHNQETLRGESEGRVPRAHQAKSPQPPWRNNGRGEDAAVLQLTWSL